VNAEGTFLGVRGGRIDLVMGGDTLAEVGVGTPLRPDVNCSISPSQILKERHTRLEYPSLGIKLSPESRSPL